MVERDVVYLATHRIDEFFEPLVNMHSGDVPTAAAADIYTYIHIYTLEKEYSRIFGLVLEALYN